jgi:hypothetical protein
MKPSTPERKPMHSGSCLCGGVRFEIDGPLEPIQICHCAQCRKAQGGAFGANIPVASSNYRLLAGAELLQEYESTPGKKRVFCRRCGSPLFSKRDALPGVLRVRAGTIEGALMTKPVSHAYVAHKADWWEIHDGLPQFPEGAA